jgi:2-dehydro-3-deoxygalactonokinase
MADTPALIAVDWGTSSFRAALLDGSGAILDRIEVPAGILAIPDGDFGGAFDRLVGPWLQQQEGLPVVASGMIGSRQGWRETPYATCPAGAADLAEKLVAVTSPGGHEVWLVPGVMRTDEDGVPDVMRGEETQIVGCLAKGDPPRRVFVLPGTHSKWAVVEEGRIGRFATFMTGELFAVLREHSILGRLMVGDTHILDAFQRGVVYGSRSGAGLLKQLFSARTLPLLERLPAAHVASYLSGLLIGHEIAEASTWIGSPHVAAGSPTIVGAATLVQRYAEALAILGIDGRTGPADAAVVGIRRILIAAGPLAAHR